MQPQPAGVVSKSGSQASRSGSQGGRCHSVSFSDQSTEPAATRSASGSVEKRTNSGSVEKRTASASALLSAVGSAASRMGDAAGRRMSSVLNEIAGDDASFRRDSFMRQATSGSFVRAGSETFVRKKHTRQLAQGALRKLESDEMFKEQKEKQLTEAKLIETIRGTIGYLFFVMIFTVVAFTTRNSSEYWANAAMRGKFVDDAFFFGEATHEKTLHDVQFVPLFYDWLGGQFLETVTNVELGGESGYLNGYNRIIGPVRCGASDGLG